MWQRQFQASLLANREETDPRVLPQHAAAPVHNLPRRRQRWLPLAEEAAIVVARHKTDLLAVALPSHPQTQLRRASPRLLLGPLAQREEHGGKLLLRERVEGIGLILAPIHASAQPIAPGGLIKAHARVVARGDIIGPQLPRPLQECRELQVLVTADARIRSAPAGVFAHEVAHHALLKNRLKIKHIIGDPKVRRNPARIFDGRQRATRTLVRLGRGTRPEAHRRPDHVITLLH